MRPFSTVLSQGFLHVVTGVALLMMLMTVFKIHVHEESGHHGAHDHVCGMTLGSHLVDLPDQPDAPSDDATDCGHCHAGPTAHQGSPGFDLLGASIGDALARRPHGQAPPESLTYTPDPPPNRLI